MKAIIVGVAYAAPFVTFSLIPTRYEAIFLAVYMGILVASLSLPLVEGEPSAAREVTFYKGLVGGIVGLLGVALYISFLFGLFQEDATNITAATWIIFSLVFPVASLLSVSRLGSILKTDGLDGLKKRGVGSGLQSFALEYSTLRWFRHRNNLLLSLATVAMYLYGWFLLGIPFLVYSVALFVLLIISLGTVSLRLLAPFKPNEIITRIESMADGNSVDHESSSN